MEALAAAKNADAHMLEAKSKELATLFETGEYVNWKTWADYAAQGAQMLTDIAGRIIGFRAGAKALRGPQNAASKVDVPTIYGADGSLWRGCLVSARARVRARAHTQQDITAKMVIYGAGSKENLGILSSSASLWTSVLIATCGAGFES